MTSREIPASVSQRLLWMIQHYRPEFGALNCPLLCRLRGNLEPDKLQRAVDRVVARHESLRTTFAGRGMRLTQRIHPARPLPVAHVDLRGEPAALRGAVAAELSSPIDPTDWPARATLWRVADDEHVLCLNLHHLVTDAWSTGILLRDLVAAYRDDHRQLLVRTAGGNVAGLGTPAGATIAAPEPVSGEEAPGWQYADFVRWQEHMLSGEQLRRHHDYWRRQLAGGQTPRLWPAPGAADAAGEAAQPPPAPPALPAAPAPPGQPAPPARPDQPAPPGQPAPPDQTAPPGQPVAGREVAAFSVSADLDPAVVVRLREIARRHRTTLFTVLLAAFYTELHKVTGQSELAVGSMFANRSRPELRDTVGLLANMVLLRSRLTPRQGLQDLVTQVHATVIGAFAYQDLPFQMLPAGILDTGDGRADDVVFNVMADVQHTLTADGVDFELLVPDDIGSRFRFELAIAPIGATDLRAVLFHAGGNLSEAYCGDFLRGYLRTVTALAEDPGLTIDTAA